MPPDDGRAQSISSDDTLMAQGWVRRHLAAPQQAKEADELYSAAGFEVRLEPLAVSAFADKCQSCASVVCRSYVMIYTRKKNPGQVDS